MKKFIYIGLTLLLLSSCNKWFDVTSSSEIREEKHYKTVKGFQQTLNGCYIAMAEATLYGKNMTWYGPEVMAHQFQKNNDEWTKSLFDHKHKTPLSITFFDGIWDRMFFVIVNTNEGLRILEKKKSELNPIDYAVIRGEFLAIRAYLQFDLLRMYGYGNWKEREATLSTKMTVPYVTELKKSLTPQITGKEYYAALLKDLNEAEGLLKGNDPVSSGKDIKEYEAVNVDGFYKYRDLHLNYYAVKALQARVHLWFGSMKEALNAAQEIIEFSEKKGYENATLGTTIRMMRTGEIGANTTSLFTESLFGLSVARLSELAAKYFVPNATASDAIALTIPGYRINEIYEGSNSDVRGSKLVLKNSGSSSYVSLKYHSDQSTLENFRNKVNMIRIPEMYYVAAEANLSIGNKTEAIRLLNSMRTARGITELLVDTLEDEKVLTEIMKEYEKEFISEGVLFFQYKRLGIKNIPMLAEDVVMDDEEYLIPYPDFEIRSGRVQ